MIYHHNEQDYDELEALYESVIMILNASARERKCPQEIIANIEKVTAILDDLIHWSLDYAQRHGLDY